MLVDDIIDANHREFHKTLATKNSGISPMHVISIINAVYAKG